MIGMQISQFKAGFFDREKVKESMSDATIAALGKFGAFVQRRAKSSLRTAKNDKPSKPGRPPKSREGSLKNWILFAADGPSNVVIGPAILNMFFFNNDRRPVNGTVPQVLEYGGQINILEVFKWGRWRRADLRSKRRNAELKSRFRRVNIAARPFMNPAFDKEISKAPKLWEAAMR